MSKEAMKLALEALERMTQTVKTNDETQKYKAVTKAIAALREALAEQPAPPVAWPCLIAEADFSENTVTLAMQCTDYKVSAGTHWLYTSTPRTWVGLTDEEIDDHWITAMWNTEGTRLPIPEFARAIEAKLEDKNNA